MLSGGSSLKGDAAVLEVEEAELKHAFIKETRLHGFPGIDTVA